MKINLTLEDIGQSLTRPIIFDIVKQMQKITDITDDVKIFFPGDIQKMQTPGSSIDTNENKNPLLGTDKYNFIEVIEEYDIEALSTTAIDGREHIPVFIDKTLDMYIAPIYATTNITINFKHTFTSKVEAMKWYDNIRSKISAMNEINLHEISYHYLLSKEIMLLLKAIYTNIENYLGYGQTFEEYIKSKSTSRLTMISDLVNSDYRLAVAETQTRIVGLYDFSGLPDKPERDESTGTWTLSYGYKFSYEKPLSCFVKYPAMVHNELIPAEYITAIKHYKDPIEINTSRSVSFSALSIFESDANSIMRSGSHYMLRLPSFDDYIIPNVPTGTSSVFLALCQVDKTDNKTLLDLKDLGDIMLDNDVLDFIYNSEYAYVTDIYKSIININLYRNNYLVSSGNIECTQSGIIKAKTELNLRNEHRVRFSLLTDISLLSDSAFYRLMSYPKAMVKIIGSMHELLKNDPDFNNLYHRKELSRSEMCMLYYIVSGIKHISSKNEGISKSLIFCNEFINHKNNDYLFGNLTASDIDEYRRNKISFNSVQISNMIAVKK